MFKNYLDHNNVDENVKNYFKITVEAWNNIEIYLQLIVNIRPLQLSKSFTFHCMTIYRFCKSVIFKYLESSPISKMKPQMHAFF